MDKGVSVIKRILGYCGLFLLLFLVLGCNLTKLYIFSASSVLEDEERDLVLKTAFTVIDEATNPVKPPGENDEPLPNSALEYAWQMGVRCIDAPGNDPCPIDACVVAVDQYQFSLEISNELFGKKNPDDYACSADFRLTNVSGTDINIWFHQVMLDQDIWLNYQLPADDLFESNDINFYTRKDGAEMQARVSELFVVYDNPHCAWVVREDTKAQKYMVPILNPCGP